MTTTTDNTWTPQQWEQHELKNVHRTIRSLVGMHPATDWSPASID
jgi:hypothetical protein